MAFVRQYPTPPNTWLYHDEDENTRLFSDYIIRSEQAEPWLECTDEEKKEWEDAHPQPQPDEEVEQ